MKADLKISSDNIAGQTRALRLLFAGSRCLAVLAEEIELISDWREPAPLPDAPAGVLGVASLRGRMFTVLDVGALFGELESAPERIVALRGDEQLALGVSGAGEMIEIDAEEIKRSNETEPLILGMISQNDRSITVLDCRHLFAAAMRGRERRRRRF